MHFELQRDRPRERATRCKSIIEARGKPFAPKPMYLAAYNFDVVKSFRKFANHTVKKSQTNITNLSLHFPRSALMTHLKTHTGEKSNKCQCDYASFQACYFWEHIWKQTK